MAVPPVAGAGFSSAGGSGSGSGSGVSSFPLGASVGAEPDSEGSPMMASTAPTSASSSSGTLISSRVPEAGEGTSVSTLSVDTSSRGSSASTVSPTALSQRDTVPSVTDSPRAGRVTSVDMCWSSFASRDGFVASLAGLWANVQLVPFLKSEKSHPNVAEGRVRGPCPPDDRVDQSARLAASCTKVRTPNPVPWIGV